MSREIVKRSLRKYAIKGVVDLISTLLSLLIALKFPITLIALSLEMLILSIALNAFTEIQYVIMLNSAKPIKVLIQR
ncbi:hypothetical protein ES708_17757 [subsurface metagenome]